ncbi:MAG: response regulator transcription factor [bacterium]
MSAVKPRILIVDDEPDLLTVLKFGLEAEGFDVLEASDGEQALALARQAVPDLMVLDLMLPRMDGYKVCRALKFDERYRHIPVLILSARSGATDRQLALDVGADEVHTKPYEMRDLIARIRARLAQAPPRRAVA